MNGAILLARQSIESDIWRLKPSSWWKIWCFILASVQHKDFKELKRGQGYFNFTELCKTKSLGKDVTINNVEKFIKYAKQAEMLATSKSTWGVLITVAKYDTYQTISYYQSGDKSGDMSGMKAEQERNESGNINKNDKNVKNEKNEEEQQKIPNRLILSKGQLIGLAKEYPGLTTTEIKEQMGECNRYMNISSSNYTNPGLFFKGWLKKYTSDKKIKEVRENTKPYDPTDIPDISEEQRIRNLEHLKKIREELSQKL